MDDSIIKAHILILSPDCKVIQLFSLFNGEPGNLGELLRQKILQTIGLLTVNSSLRFYPSFVNSIKEYIASPLNKNGVWKSEGEKSINDTVTLNNQIDYIYLLNFYYKQEKCNTIHSNILFYSIASPQLFSKNLYRELLSYIIKNIPPIPLSTKIENKDNQGVIPF